MLVVCLTGGIGAGKSTAAQILGKLGAHVMSLDDIARGVLDPGTVAAREVAALWPEAIRGGAIDRSLLASIVFSDDDALHQLNSITHPRTWQAGERQLGQWQREDPGGIAIVELALLAQSPRKYLAHLNMVIAADLDVRIDRLVRLRAMSESDARARVAKQPPQEELRELADIWIDNSDGEKALVDKLTVVWRERLIPYAENLAAGGRLSGSSRVPDTPSVARIESRLGHHGVAVRPCRVGSGPRERTNPGSRQLEPGYDEAALLRAGFVPVPDENRFVLADPAYEFSLNGSAAS